MGEFKVTPKGVFEKYQDDLFEGWLKADFPIPFSLEHDKVDVVQEEIEEKLWIKFERMPLRLFQQVLEFLRWCYEERKSEGFVAHRYIDGVWENVPFPQWNSSGSVCYHPELLLEKATRVVGDTHSHPPSYGSQHSSTDGLDERKNNGIFIVVKGWTPMTCEPDIVGVVRGRKFHLKPESMFDLKDYDPNPSFPEEWKKMVGPTPCKACEKKREIDRVAKEVDDKKKKWEDDSFRLIPKPALEVLRAEVRKEEEKPSKALKGRWEEYKKRYNAPGNGYRQLKLVRCDNYNCKKLCGTVKCDVCSGTILTEAVVESIGDMLDELWYDENEPEAVKLIVAVCAEDAKEGGEKKVQAAKDAAVPFGLPELPPAQKTETASTASKSKVPEIPHIIIVASDRPCGDSCVYKEFPHEHAKSHEDLQAAFKEITEGRSRENCQTVGKKCLYPEMKVCDNGCTFARESVSSAQFPLGLKVSIPTCKNESCRDAGHTYLSCDVKTAFEEAERLCPSKACQASGHSWWSCEVKGLNVYLMKEGLLKPKEEKKDDETKRYPAPLPSIDGLMDIIVGDSAVCPGEKCSHFGRTHQHEIAKSVTSPGSSSASTSTPASTPTTSPDTCAGWEGWDG